jgi:two-component system response regulator (stage 0 sporulation protein A)
VRTSSTAAQCAGHKAKASDILCKIGIPANIKGRQYLIDSAMLLLREPERINSMMTLLYPAIAKKHNATSAGVERAIRHAIGRAWLKSGAETINSCFGYATMSRPSNSEFIALLTDKIKHG